MSHYCIPCKLTQIILNNNNMSTGISDIVLGISKAEVYILENIIKFTIVYKYVCKIVYSYQ